MFTRNLYSRLFMLATAVAFFVVAATCVFSQTKLLRFPDISGDRVAFTYAGDIWTAPVAGGTAIRLTAHPGMEVFAKFSPDGKWIAFTGQYDGNFNVYVMPATGGQPKQLTFYQGAAQPLSDRMGIHSEVITWTNDSKRVVFLSRRDASPYGQILDPRRSRWVIFVPLLQNRFRS